MKILCIEYCHQCSWLSVVPATMYNEGETYKCMCDPVTEVDDPWGIPDTCPLVDLEELDGIMQRIKST